MCARVYHTCATVVASRVLCGAHSIVVRRRRRSCCCCSGSLCLCKPRRPCVSNPLRLYLAWKFPSDKCAPFKINRRERCPEFIVVDCFGQSRPHPSEAAHQTLPLNSARLLPSNFPQLIPCQSGQRINRLSGRVGERLQMMNGTVASFFLFVFEGLG